MRLEILGADEVTAEAELETSAATRTSAPSSVAKANVRFMCVLSCPGGGGDARADCREKGTHVYRRCPRREESVPWVECPPKSPAERTWLARRAKDSCSMCRSAWCGRALADTARRRRAGSRRRAAPSRTGRADR